MKERVDDEKLIIISVTVRGIIEERWRHRRDCDRVAVEQKLNTDSLSENAEFTS